MQPTALVRERPSPPVRIVEQRHLIPVWGAQRSQNIGEGVEACYGTDPAMGQCSRFWRANLAGGKTCAIQPVAPDICRFYSFLSLGFPICDLGTKTSTSSYITEDLFSSSGPSPSPWDPGHITMTWQLKS